MGIKVEFNPDLALRRYETPGRHISECIPEKLKTGEIHDFLKKGQRNYWLNGEIPLVETEGNEELSRPIASIKIIEATHFLLDKEIFTRGKYEVVDIYDTNSGEVHFKGFQKR